MLPEEANVEIYQKEGKGIVRSYNLKPKITQRSSTIRYSAYFGQTIFSSSSLRSSRNAALNASRMTSSSVRDICVALSKSISISVSTSSPAIDRIGGLGSTTFPLEFMVNDSPSTAQPSLAIESPLWDLIGELYKIYLTRVWGIKKRFSPYAHLSVVHL